MRTIPATLAAAVVVVFGTVVPSAQQGARGGEWTRYGADAGTTKYSPLDQINKDNVARLQIAWRRPAVDPSISSKDPEFSYSGNFRATPLMIGGVLYSPNGIGLVEAFHPGTGKTIWVQQPFPDEGAQSLRGDSTRGLTYWTEGSDRRLFAVRGEYLVALDPATGKPVPSFGENGRVALRPGLGPRATRYAWTGAAQVCRDVVIVGVGIGGSMSDRATQRQGVPGVVQAFDVRTGKPRWRFSPIPRPGEVGAETWEDDSWSYAGDANLWSLIAADEQEGLAYLPMTSPTSDMYGGHRLGHNLFANTLVCVRCATGERAWHYQIVHHDLWDYDLPAAPILADIRVDGKPIKAVVQLTKQAFAYVFDRVTGRPVWPIEERPVPTSNVPGERTAPTQPFPTKPPAFDRQGVTIDDLIDFTPELRAEAVALLKYYRIGPLFTPPSVRGTGPEGHRGTIQLPGSVGGADWQSGAFDPETGILYVQSITGPFTADVVKPETKTDLNYVSGIRAWTAGPKGLPLFKPPYGRITGIDLNRGEIKWMTPNGDGPRNHPLLKPLNLPPLGSPGRSSPLVTKTLLFLGEGDPVMAGLGSRLRPEMPASLAPGYGGRRFRAFDKATGAILWETELPAGVTGAPMTYMFEGKQYVLAATGTTEPRSAGFVALSLP
ncbi:MAG: pyrroloquinoline quinone-dependent dehydrogenase [Acidimicrobiia bacterium]|nr:pyrroloquinoline quinone-dependent dehydrogenase [Acidimicrobiia bacterium]